MATHDFAQTPPDTIARHRAAKRFLDADPEAALRQFIGAKEHSEVGTRAALSEIVRCHRAEIPAGWDIVIHAKSAVAKAPFAALTMDLLRLLQSGAQATK